MFRSNTFYRQTKSLYKLIDDNIERINISIFPICIGVQQRRGELKYCQRLELFSNAHPHHLPLYPPFSYTLTHRSFHLLIVYRSFCKTYYAKLPGKPLGYYKPSCKSSIIGLRYTHPPPIRKLRGHRLSITSFVTPLVVNIFVIIHDAF